ncbi:MAG: hypothetical protein KKB20_03170 [Proteobacteria bacterium]|nr:hypothetical protein [Pseudomonadota bacterium]
MGLDDFLENPAVRSFLRFWLAVTLGIWLLMCGLALVSMYGRLHASMVPYQIILTLALVPISVVVLVVQVVLSLTGPRIWPGNAFKCKRLVLIGTPLIAWLCLWLLLLLAGGAGSFLVVI